MPTHRKQRADGARTREAIVREAVSLATVDGLDGLSIGNLATALDMSKSGLYAHFKSKEELELATIDAAAEIFENEVMRKVPESPGGLARITALLRRSRVAHEPVPDLPRLTFGAVSIDLDAQLVTKDGQPVHLTPTEFALLRELALAPGKLLTHAALLRSVWGPGYETATEYTRVYVRRLRAKLEDPDGPALIVTEPRAGYRLVPIGT